MMTLSRYKKKGLPLGLIKIHEFLVKDIILYFEKSRFITTRIKASRKSTKQALKFAKKKKIYPSKMTDQALTAMNEIIEEVDYTHQVLKEAAAEMLGMIEQIKEERFEKIYTLINNARLCFRENRLESGMELLQKAQDDLSKTLLVKTRENFFYGIDSKIKAIKSEIEKNSEADAD